MQPEINICEKLLSSSVNIIKNFNGHFAEGSKNVNLPTEILIHGADKTDIL